MQFNGKPLFFADRMVTKGRIIIDDLSVGDDFSRMLGAFGDLKVVSASELSGNLAQLMSGELSGNCSKLCVFPGNGGCIFRHYWPPVSLATQVPAKRIWSPGSDPVALVGQIDDPRFLIMDEMVVVLDDVISSGATLKLIYERNLYRTPSSRWIAGCWLSQMPRKGYPLADYSAIYTALLVESPDGRRVPINSLSTLVENEEILTSYAERSGYGHELIQLIRTLDQ